MRVLEFKVNKQAISKQPGCDFSGIVAGSSGYLTAKFNFSNDWDDCEKQAIFWYGDEQRRMVSLDENGECSIPPVALTGKLFEVSVIGEKNGRSGYQIETNKFKVRQTVV